MAPDDRPEDPLAWMQLQTATMCRADASGRLTAANKRLPRDAPIVFLGRTTTGNVWRLRADVPQRLAQAFEAELEGEPTPLAIDGQPPLCSERLFSLAREMNPDPVLFCGPAFRFVRPPAATATDIVPATPENLAGFLDPGETVEDVEPCRVRVVDGQWIAICHSSRIGKRACEAGVETTESARGRGHAVDVTAAWASAVFESGREPLYSTWWDNHASRAVARKLRLECFGEDWHLT